MITKAEDKYKFLKMLGEENLKRIFPVAIMDLFFPILMTFSQYQSYQQSPEPIVQQRSSYLFRFAGIFSIISIISFIALLYISKKKNTSKAALIISYYYFFLNIAWGVSTNIALFLVDGEPFFVYFIAFTLASCLMIIVRPIYSLFIITLMGIISLYAFKFLPQQLNLPEIDPYIWFVFIETVLIISVISFVLSIVMYNVTVRDFNNRYTIEKLNDDLSRSLKIDQLTQIYNRKEFSRKIVELKEQELPRREWLSIAMIDIDFFKQYNDTYGHLEGDQCLYKIAQTLQKTIHEQSPEAVVARFGGEEFIVAMIGENATIARMIMEKSFEEVTALQIEHINSKTAPVVTLSGGIYTLASKEELAIHEAIRKADEQLYKAKQTGRNKIVSDIA